MIIYRLENERIAEHWMQFDSVSLLEQLQAHAAIARRRPRPDHSFVLYPVAPRITVLADQVQRP
jgi:hypothetical protein